MQIREAAQALLLAELRCVGSDGRKHVVDDWSPFLPSYVDPSVSLLSDGQSAANKLEVVGSEETDDQMLGGSK